MRDPDYTGAAAKGWKVRIDPEQFDRPDQQATLAGFLVVGPFHPHWDTWMLALIHLRPIEGEQHPSRPSYEGAEYELMVLAQNPAKPVTDPDDLAQIEPMTPADLCFQFDLKENDEMAVEIVEAFVETMVEGKSSPDSDYRRVNEQHLQEAIDLVKETL